ncbi:hypothetical protein F5878DRAFT_667706 [Lentinula raphanica]|uniref:Uncharacterized protein n=1 Tax=Lentinula raphanica TaxID=153919 RepID=A0AA38NVA2_9AGAR|nr:hypothetical protein F5878DRAFT_667706 [Lentinula raphanica]
MPTPTSGNANKRKRHDKKRRNFKAKAKSGAAPLAQVKAVNLFSQFNEEEEFEDEEEKDEEEEDEEEKASAVPKSHVRGLTKEVRAELDQWHVEYKEGIKKIAARSGVDMHACFTYLNQQLHPPRAINRFNAFKAHYAEYGTIKKSSTQSLSDYNKLLREEYWKTLESRLSVGELQDPKARSRAMKPEVDWYREQVKNYIETAKESGKVKGTVKAMIRPVLTLAEKLYETSGYHMLGWLINTSSDKFGRSVSAFFAGDHIAKVAKERFGSKMESQVADMETMFKMLEMENRQVDAAVAKLHSACTAGPKESRRDVERRLTNMFFQHDVDQFLGKENNIKLNTFIGAAMKQHIRLLNWPIAFFPKANIDTYKQISAKDVKTIFIPRKAHFDHLYAIQTKAVDPDEDIELDTTYGFEYWTAGEQALRVEDQGAVPLVVDVNNNVVVTVDDAKAWKLQAAARKLQRKNASKAPDMTLNAVHPPTRAVHAPALPSPARTSTPPVLALAPPLVPAPALPPVPALAPPPVLPPAATRMRAPVHAPAAETHAHMHDRAVTAPAAVPGRRPLPRPLPRTNAVAGPSKLRMDHNTKRGREEEVSSDRLMKKAKGKGKGKAMTIDLEEFRI